MILRRLFNIIAGGLGESQQSQSETSAPTTVYNQFFGCGGQKIHPELLREIKIYIPIEGRVNFISRMEMFALIDDDYELLRILQRKKYDKTTKITRKSLQKY